MPAGIDEEELKEVLHQHPALQPPHADLVNDGHDGKRIDNGVQVHTLTHDLQHSQVATVHFQYLLQRLRTLAPGDQLTINVNLSLENRLVSSKRKRGFSTIRFAIDRHFRGITVLSSPPADNYTVDVLAVHSLGGHPYGSFVDKGDGHMWLSESLPRDMPTARVMIYGYESGLQDSTSFARVNDLAGSLQSLVKSAFAFLSYVPGARTIYASISSTPCPFAQACVPGRIYTIMPQRSDDRQLA